MLRSTKIVATLGPASSDPAILERMIRAGVDVVRLNFSHGTAKDHEGRAQLVKDLSAKIGRTVAILCDLQGPKIRVGKFKDGKVTRPGLGVQVAADQVARQLQQTGVLITEVQPNTPAAQAGLRPTYLERGRVRPGDVLVAIDGQPVKKVGDLFDHLEKRKVGDTVTIQVLRGDKPVDVKVQLVALE